MRFSIIRTSVLGNLSENSHLKKYILSTMEKLPAVCAAVLIKEKKWYILHSDGVCFRVYNIVIF